MRNATPSATVIRYSVKALFLAVTAAAAIGIAAVPGIAEAAKAPPHSTTVTASLSTTWSLQFPDAQFATVDPAGNIIMVCNDETGIEIAKYDASGTLQGTWRIADTSPVLAVATDPSGNVLVATSVAVTGLTATGTPNFTYVPALPILAMTVDTNGNVVIAENDWDSDLVIEKLDASGVGIGKKTFSSTGGIEDLALATDSAGNIIVALTYQDGTINFGGSALTSPYMDTLIVAKLSPTGNHVFSKIYNPTVAKNGSYAGIYEVQVAVKSTNEIVVTGTIDGAGKFTIGGKNVTLPPEGWETMFVAQLSPTGNTSYAKTLGMDGVHPEALAIDNQDNVIVIGEDQGGKLLGIARGVFVAKLAGTNGSVLSKSLVDGTAGYANSIAVSPTTNQVVVSGSNSDTNYAALLVN